MKYNSTTNKNIVVSASQAIAQGISSDGGLFVPMEIPQYAINIMAEFFLEQMQKEYMQEHKTTT